MVLENSVLPMIYIFAVILEVLLFIFKLNKYVRCVLGILFLALSVLINQHTYVSGKLENIGVWERLIEQGIY